jgi:hypothetical protein
MVADSVGNTFRPGGLQRQQQGQYQRPQQSLEEQERYRRQQPQALSQSIQPPAAIQDIPPDVLTYPNDRTFQSQSMNAADDEERTTLSHETRLKIEELKRLVYKYSQYVRNPDAIIKCATHFSINGDNQVLDDMLEKFRMFRNSG